MTEVDGQGRPESPLVAGEVETLVGFLEYQRATFAWKSGGLGAEGLDARVGVSSMTLGWMLRHLAYYEDQWISHRMCGNERLAMWQGADPDGPAHERPEELRELWEAAVERSRGLLAETIAEGGLDQLAKRSMADGQAVSVRWIVLHMIEEYARHNGHADLIRESVDGLVGE